MIVTDYPTFSSIFAENSQSCVLHILDKTHYSYISENHQLLIDPGFSVNPLAKDVKKELINPDYILLTHAHGDHTSDVIEIAKRSNASIISNYEICLYYGRHDIAYHPMNHGGRWNFDFGTVAMVNAIHTSSFPDGTYGGNPAGFIITSGGKTIYIAGDTALTLDMKLIPQLYPPLDLAVLPIGNNFTMGIDDAIIASSFVQCQNILGCHYDTFPYIKIDQEEARRKFSNANVHLTLLEIGESMNT